MAEVIYKIRVNRPCRLFIDDEEMMILDGNRLTKITLPEGEYLRKVVAIDNKAIFDEAEIVLSGASKLDTITLDTTGLEEAKRNALPKEQFQVGDLMYKALEDGSGVAVAKYVDKKITEVIIPDAITFGHYIYEVKEIGKDAFYNYRSLTSITIPESVTSIGDYAFLYCSSLTSITIPNSVTSIGDSAFSCCSGLTSITIPNSVTNIGDSAFSHCSSLTSIIIPESVTSIGKGAFEGRSALTSITIPNSVTNIGKEAFRYCSSLTSIIVEKGNAVYDSRANCNAIIETATNTLISGCQNTIIPNSVTSIRDWAFADCSGLTSITIPNSVTNIGKGAFNNCSGLSSITIPNSVTSIGDWAFLDCSSLTSIVVEQGNAKYDSRENCNAIIETATNTLTRRINVMIIRGCQNTTIPNSVTIIGWGAFRGCSGLTSITIPNSVTSIGDYAFLYCSSLTSVTIPNSVTRIGGWAFADCSSLKSVTIPNSVTSIGRGAFPDHTQIIRK